MRPASSSFQVGQYSCRVLVDGSSQPFFRDMPDRFPDIQENLLLEALQNRRPHADFIHWSMNCLLLQSPDQAILVDTGIGPRSDGGSGQALPLLSETLSPQEIDLVIITHGHPDHIGGLVDLEGQLYFPNARYLMWHSEWEHWMGQDGVIHQADPDLARFLRAKLDPIQTRLQLLEEETEIAPGIRPVFAPGHTPGHIGLHIESQDEALFVLSDTLHAKIQLDHPEWSPRYDHDPDLAADTRQRLLTQAANRQVLSLVYHFQAPGLGRISKTEQGTFAWHPGKG